MALRDELRQRRENLRTLEEQEAQFGIAAPLWLINEIKHERREIERIVQALAAEEAESDTALADVNEERAMEARFNSVETTLRNMESKLDNVQAQIHSLDNRMVGVEHRLAQIERQIMLQQATPLTRQALVSMSVVLVVMLILLVVITWQIFR